MTHRADGSGTTYVWTDYLSKISDGWNTKVGKGTSVNWPVGLGGKGNEGVAGLLKQTPNSIGYLELIYAVQNHLRYGRVQNSSGKFVKAELASVTGRGRRSFEIDARRLPCLDHECERAQRVSDFEFHVVAGIEQDAGRAKEEGDYGVPTVDAHERAGLRRTAGIFSAAPRGDRQRDSGDSEN